MAKILTLRQNSMMAVVSAPARVIHYLPAQKALNKRIESIDLLRGVVMIIMAVDHVRDYFHYDAFMYSPTDLSRTNAGLFFTRFITHYCAPVFVFLAGTSSYLYGLKRRKSELSFFLLTRGVWLVLIEIFAVGLFRTFNLAYTFSSLQVIWAIGLSMMALSAIIYMNRALILLTGLLLVVGHNALDAVHVQGNSLPAFLWSILHDEKHFTFGRYLVYVHYPVLPWLGVMILGYYLGSLYVPDYDPRQRKRILRLLGVGALGLFVILRLDNWYGDAAHWSVQKNAVFSLLSFLNVTKYPPSLLYLLITLGPALILLATMEKPLNSLTRKIVTFGRVPMFYYLAHILLIHILAALAALITGHSGMGILNGAVNSIPELKGYGFGLATVYVVWIAIVLLLYPLCKWFEGYKRRHQSEYWWLSYL
jgi:Predicted membrane protein